MASTATKIFLGFGCAVLLVIGLLMVTCAGCATMMMHQAANRSGPETARQHKIAVTRRIAYSVVRPMGYHQRWVRKGFVVSPKNRNEADLRALGDTLRWDIRGDRNAFVYIFDNTRAAKRHNFSFCGRHYLGQYNRNINTGYHRLDIQLNDCNGNVVLVNY